MERIALYPSLDERPPRAPINAFAGPFVAIAARPIIRVMAKYGKVKRQHGRVTGLDEILDRIVRDCPHVTRIIPGRMGRKRGKVPGGLKIQYATTPGGNSSAPANGLKCIYTRQGSWQEVFLVCSDAAEAQRWLETNNVVT